MALDELFNLELLGALEEAENRAIVNRPRLLPKMLWKVLTALRFFASGSYQLDIGDNRSSALSQPSVSRCIAEVSNALNQPDIICDSDARIMNVNAKYPGDSGYPLRPWLLTPLSDPIPDTPESLFNKWSTIERCNGILKMRFRCLLKHRVLHYNPERASKIIVSCCILHNMCINANLPVPQREPDDPLDIDFGIYGVPELNPINPQLAAGRRVQQLLIRSYFT
ncbi:hypothetical protein ACI65C_004467 [Semiaphis heraclei]